MHFFQDLRDTHTILVEFSKQNDPKEAPGSPEKTTRPEKGGMKGLMDLIGSAPT